MSLLVLQTTCQHGDRDELVGSVSPFIVLGLVGFDPFRPSQGSFRGLPRGDWSLPSKRSQKGQSSFGKYHPIGVFCVIRGDM